MIPLAKHRSISFWFFWKKQDFSVILVLGFNKSRHFLTEDNPFIILHRLILLVVYFGVNANFSLHRSKVGSALNTPPPKSPYWKTNISNIFNGQYWGMEQKLGPNPCRRKGRSTLYQSALPPLFMERKCCLHDLRSLWKGKWNSWKDIVATKWNIVFYWNYRIETRGCYYWNGQHLPK